MRLRRGMIRESCDFCHRRKIKCDRLSRNDLGHASCSQCSLRSVQCCMDDSDDIRLRGRSRPAPPPSASALLSPNIGAPSPSTSSPASTSSPSAVRRTLRQKGMSQSPRAVSVALPAAPNQFVLAAGSPVSPSSDEQVAARSARGSYSSQYYSGQKQQPQQQHQHQHQHHQHQQQSLQLAESLTAASLATPSSINLDVGEDSLVVQPPLPAASLLTTSPLPYGSFGNDNGVNPISTCIVNSAPPSSSMTEDLMFMDDPFQLNADSIFFLDQIFMGYPDPSASAESWPNPSSEAQPLVFTQPPMQSTISQEGQSLGVSSTPQQLGHQSFPSQALPLHQQSHPQEQQTQQTSQQQLLLPSTSSVAHPSVMLKDGGYDPPPWTRCGLDETTFVDALKAYFTYVTLYLPVLLEDAFWQDYYTGRCSLSIIYAVACRGLPFVRPNADKKTVWAQQQHVAEHFREAFFAAQLSANHNRGRVRLDDLEALALMVNFKNFKPSGSADGSSSSSTAALAQLHAHLTGLYLTHDSLVLMTMQSGIDTPDTVNSNNSNNNNNNNNNNSNKNNNTSSAANVASAAASLTALSTATASDPKAPLTRLNDRRILLFWHVYGIDSFHCLDKKLISRIPDYNHQLLLSVTGGDGSSIADPSKKTSLPSYSNGAAASRGYLDAVLDLAILARQVLVSLTNATARRRGIRTEDLENVYGLFEQWQRVACPPHLRRQRDPVTKKLSLTAGLDANSNTNVIHLHRAVIWILEINCFIQIEDCACEFGIYDPTASATATPSIEAEAIALRIEAETVCRLRDGVEIARSLLAYRPDPESSGSSSPRQGQYSLADLGKSVVRDCFHGLALWACRRGSQQLRRPMPTMLESRRLPAESDGTATPVISERQRQRAASYVEAATVLRDVVATAVSHADTKPAVGVLNDKISALKAEMEGMSSER